LRGTAGYGITFIFMNFWVRGEYSEVRYAPKLDTHIILADPMHRTVQPNSHLVGHEQVCVVTLLITGILEELGKARQTDVVTVKVAVQGVVYVAYVVLDAAWGGRGNTTMTLTHRGKTVFSLTALQLIK